MHIIYNFPLMSAFISMIIAQLMKVPLYWLRYRIWDFRLAMNTGGMPSSHSAAVTALTTSIGIRYGWDSSMFAIVAVFSAITMYDATGIRRQAGIHATILNRITKELSLLTRDETAATQLKELLGHRKVEVLGGLLLGVSLSCYLYYFVYTSYIL
ncbi:acid phosphatase family membrane protein YuiD [Paenibacillus shirakamiensis]|uniref:Acid phosphatase family membrane protein YuiD n=1 Tax=Paenibacillus shirakamiensis TaxID=1265935 RepID=A0ABS4JEL2_9BACL|nr:divergent PAP2 family protein [Paenibacillus shirakamiensis]MBP2000157.1 acid phosphatase family membrane protein YuiD [Paenibacillus shirakamiensis]